MTSYPRRLLADGVEDLLDPFRYAVSSELISELLHPALVPESDLCRIRRLVSRLAGPKAEAGARFLRRLGAIDDLQADGFCARCAELDEAVEAVKEADACDWAAPASDAASQAAHRVWEFCTQSEQISESYWSLRALEGLELFREMSDLSDFLSGESWVNRMEIQTRWLWMRHHEDLIAAGTPPRRPYACVLGDRRTPERKKDREYHALRLFLHGLKMLTGEEWLPISKGETPDFVVADSSGLAVGLEMREVPISQAWADSEDHLATVRPAVEQVSRRRGVAIDFMFPPAWESLDADASAFTAWLESGIISGQPLPTRGILLEGPRWRVGLKIAPSTDPLVGVHLDDLTDQDQRAAERELGMAILRAVEKKIWRDPADRSKGPRRAPQTTPCHLVLYPNHDIGPELAAACSVVRAQAPPTIWSHFVAVWVSREQGIERIL